VDFVRKSVRAIGRCAIKVEQAAERCVSTLIDLIQTKVNYVVQEAIVVIKVRKKERKILFSTQKNFFFRIFFVNIQINMKV
jgi:vesicle coat complex subunit